MARELLYVHPHDQRGIDNVETSVTAAVFQEGPVWVVQVPSASGTQRYQCPDEKQARRLEALFSAPPKVQPLRRR